MFKLYLFDYYKKETEYVWLNIDVWGTYPGEIYMDYDWRIIIYPIDSLYDVETIR